MELFSLMYKFFASLPAWVLFVPPSLLILCAVPLFLSRKKRLYLWCSAMCFVAGVLFSAGMEEQILYLAVFAGLILLLLPLFSIPLRRKKETREEKLYQKFKGELTGPIPGRRSDPPKVCCFEEQSGETAEERGIRLSYVISLLDKLKKEKLTPADRLEVETLSRSVAGAETRPLTDSEADDLSDSLAAVLRLTAKYN